MLHDRPFHRPESGHLLEAYATRMLVGFAASIGLLLVVIYFPVSNPAGHIGWSYRAADRISLSMVQETQTQEANPQKETGVDHKAPPPTQHGTPEVRSTSDAVEGDSEGHGQDEENGERTGERTERPPVRNVATLSARDKKPQVIGGLGSLYLHIQYPHAARMKGIEGRVKLDFTVGTDGDVRRVRVAKSLHPLCDSAAVRALRSVRFRPAKQDGKPIPVRMRLPIRFQLRADSKTISERKDSPSGENR